MLSFLERKKRCTTVMRACVKGQITQLLKAESQHRKGLLLFPFVDASKKQLGEGSRSLPGDLLKRVWRLAGRGCESTKYSQR